MHEIRGFMHTRSILSTQGIAAGTTFPYDNRLKGL
jgi:hypothetical protein